MLLEMLKTSAQEQTEVTSYVEAGSQYGWEKCLSTGKLTDSGSTDMHKQ